MILTLTGFETLSEFYLNINYNLTKVFHPEEADEGGCLEG